MKVGNTVYVEKYNGRKVPGKILEFRNDLVLIKHNAGPNSLGTVWASKTNVTPRNSYRLVRTLNGKTWSSRGRGGKRGHRVSHRTKRRN